MDRVYSFEWGGITYEHSRWIDLEIIEFVVSIDKQINLKQRNITPEEAVSLYVPWKWRNRTLAEYQRWNILKEKNESNYYD